MRGFTAGFIASVCGVLFALPVIGWAQEPEDTGNALFEGKPVEISMDFAFYSKYIWRGFKLDNDPVAQSGVYINAYGINASIWGSLDMDGRDDSKSDEVDYAIGYTYNLEEMFKVPVSVTGGYIYYNFPAAKANSQEFYLGLSADSIMLSPSFTWYHDFEDENKGGGKGDYIVAQVNHSFLLPDMPVTLDIGGHAGYNHRLFIKGKGGDIGLSAGLAFNLLENCTLSPCVKYSIPLGDLKKADDGDQQNQFYGGAVMAMSF
jgi:hypothetical protein